MLIVQFKTPYSNKIYKELVLSQAEQKELAREFDLHLLIGCPIAQDRSNS